MSKLRLFRIIFAIISIFSVTVLFLGFSKILDTFIDEIVLQFQFIPSFLRFAKGLAFASTGFLIITLLTFLFGRIYCSFICPLGIFQDILLRVEKRFKLKKRQLFAYSNPAPWLKHLLLGATIVTFISGSTGLLLLLDPYSNFGRMATHIIQPIFQFINNSVAFFANKAGFYSIYHIDIKAFDVVVFGFSLFLVLTLVLMTFFSGRLFCNTVCPVGTLLGWASRISFLKIKIDPNKCTGCKKCERQCKARCIDIENMKVDFDRCVACYNCMDVCNDSAIDYRLKNKKQPTFTPVNQTKRDLLKTLALGITGLTFLSAKDVKSATSSFTTSKPSVSKLPVIPPGSVSIEHFKSTCTACHLCISACPTNVLQSSFIDFGIDGLFLPKMDYHVNYCNFECTLCSNVCPTGAILPLTTQQKTLTQIGRVVFVKENCVVTNNHDDCGACAEHCPTQAVYMVPYQEYLMIPEIIPDQCVGCGACEHVCPSGPNKAIYVESNFNHQLAIMPKPKNTQQKEEIADEFPF